MANRVNVEITGDSKDFRSELQKADKSVSGWKVGVGAAAGFVAAELGARAAGAVKDFVADSINAFSDLNESVNAVQVSYGDAADAVLALGDDSARAFGLSSRAVNDAAVQLSAFVHEIDAADPAGAFEEILGRATDFASVMNLDVSEALAKFQSGLAGQSEPLMRYGINLQDAAIKAHALEVGIIDVDREMSATEKVQARYSLLMQETAKTAGDFANTADSLANRQRTLKAQWEEMQASVGERLAPAMVKMLEAATDLLPVFAELVTQVVNLVKPVADVVGWLNKYSGEVEIGEEKTSGLAAALKGAISGPIRGLPIAFAPAIDKMRELGLLSKETEYDFENLDVAAAKLALGIEEGSKNWQRGRKHMRDLGEETEETADKTKILTGNMRDYQNALRALTDPVFRLKRAQEEYNEVLAETTKDGKLTAEELDSLTQATIDLDAAQAAVSPANMEAYLSAQEDAARRARDQVQGLKSDVIDLDGLTVTGKMAPNIHIAFHAQALTERDILNALKKLQREGKLPSSGAIAV